MTTGAVKTLSDEEAYRKVNGITKGSPTAEPTAPQTLPAPAAVVPSEKTREKFLLSVANSAGQTKRGLLDFIDFQEEVLLKDPALAGIHDRIKDLFAYSRRRVHNDISTMRDQVLACFQIYVNGGEIPAFGRTEEQRTASAQKDRGR